MTVLTNFKSCVWKTLTIWIINQTWITRFTPKRDGASQNPTGANGSPSEAEMSFSLKKKTETKNNYIQTTALDLGC